MNALMKRLARDEEAGTAVEYGLLVGLIAVAIIGAGPAGSLALDFGTVDHDECWLAHGVLLANSGIRLFPVARPLATGLEYRCR